MVEQALKVRLDKWLWSARLYKTRAIAAEMVNGGKVHYNQQRCRASKIVEVGAQLKLQQGYEQKEVIVLAITDKRGNASIAQTLYNETEESKQKRALLAEQRKLNAVIVSQHKPDKKQRRTIIKFKQQQ